MQRSATLSKKRLWHRCFPVNFAKFLRTPFSIEHLWWLLLWIYLWEVFATRESGKTIGSQEATVNLWKQFAFAKNNVQIILESLWILDVIRQNCWNLNKNHSPCLIPFLLLFSFNLLMISLLNTHSEIKSTKPF